MLIKISPVLRQYVYVVIVNFTFLHMGADIAWLSPMIVKLRDVNQTILPRELSDTETAWIVSISNIFALVAMPFTSYLANNFGRKRAILLSALPRILTCFLFIFAKDVWMMLLGRCLSGIADFIGISLAATYASEIASKELRGSLGTISQILSAIGAMIMLSVGPFVSYINLHIINMAVFVGTTLTIVFIPESPYYLYCTGELTESKKILITLRNSEALAQKEMNEYTKIHHIGISKKELIKDKKVIKVIVKVIAFSILMQFTGFNTVMFYLQHVFELTNTNVSSNISSVIVGCVQLFACLCTIFIADRFGRKYILIISIIGIGIGMMGLGTFFWFENNEVKITGFLNYVPLVSIMLVIYSYNAGLGSLYWMQVSELFDSKYRPLGLSIAAFTAFLFVFITVRYFPVLIKEIGPAYTYWTFSVCCIIFILYIAIVIPETKGKSYLEIQREMGRLEVGEKSDVK